MNGQYERTSRVRRGAEPRPVEPVDLSHRTTRRGPISSTHNGRGSRPWLPETTCDPGWVYLSGHEKRRLCRRCAVQVSAIGEGKAPSFYEEEPPAEGDRCQRCLRSYGARSDRDDAPGLRCGLLPHGMGSAPSGPPGAAYAVGRCGRGGCRGPRMSPIRRNSVY